MEGLDLQNLEDEDLVELDNAVNDMIEANDYLEADDSRAADYVAMYPDAYTTQALLETSVDDKVEEATDIVEGLSSTTENVTTDAAVSHTSSTVILVLAISRVAFG